MVGGEGVSYADVWKSILSRLMAHVCLFFGEQEGGQNDQHGN